MPMQGRQVKEDLWARYAEDLANFLHMVRAGARREAQGALAIRVATSLQKSGLFSASLATTLYPIEF